MLTGRPLASHIEDEIEAKFVLRDAAEAESILRALGQFAELRAEPSEQVLDTYIDSIDLELYAAGLGCRIRQKQPPDGAATWSLECKAIQHGGDAIKVRQETRQPLPGPVHPDDLPAGPVRNLLGATLTTPACTILTLNNSRQHYRATTHQHAVFDVCIDLVDVKDSQGKRISGFRELEIERVSGEFADLQGLLGQLEGTVTLNVSRLGKFERSIWLSGTRLKGGHTHSQETPAWTLLVTEMQHDLRLIGLSRAVALEGIDSEGVHQVRTNTRRLRAALALASPWLGEEGIRFSREFRELAAMLGEVRDLDVYATQTMARVAGLPDVRERTVAQLRLAVTDAHERARQKARTWLQRPALDSLFERLAECLERQPDSHPELCSRQLAENQLVRRSRNVRRAIKALGDAPGNEALHELRIRVKKFRYTAELFGGVLPDQLQDVTRVARGVQDLLGKHQDACVAIMHGQRLASQLPLIPQNRDVLVTLGRLQAEYEREAATIAKTFLAGATGRELARSLKQVIRTL